MSASRCLRCAIEAVRPTKRVNIQSRLSIQSRSYADGYKAPKAAGSETARTATAQDTVLDEKVERIVSQPKRPVPRAPAPKSPARSSPEEHPLPTAQQLQEQPDRDHNSPVPLPPNVLAAFRTPYRHKPPHGIPVASLQLRSFSVRNLEFMSDFAMRVAYYLKLPASGPTPLPKKIERWTMPRSNFVHKKSQENFERITMRRVITVFDGAPEVVEVWLAALRKWQFYGVGMKCNVWAFEGLDVSSKMDRQLADVEKELDAKLANFGWNNSVAPNKSIQELLLRQGARTAGTPMMEIRDDIKGAKNVDLFRDVK